MLRLSIPNAIALGIVVVVIGWLALRPPADRPVNSPVTNVPVIIQPEGTDSETLAALQATIAGLIQRLDVLESETTDPAASLPPATAKQTPVKAIFPTQVLYLGAATTTERQWTETGAQVRLSSANYPAGVNVVFEAGLSIIGGEAWARLKNKTTGAIISISEVFNNSDAVVWKSSGAFKLHPGDNLYVVEIKSSSGETANLSGSRLQLSQ